ncbi:hypothetical protein [Paraburkholderia bryophila]|uniref:hypothetical protein n=1 Tax=Paraburkholderia bryophila TaxID=420952 RepID=UPI001C549929|nr:hypothetical protein [Paraburkholderia bryophila]
MTGIDLALSGHRIHPYARQHVFIDRSEPQDGVQMVKHILPPFYSTPQSKPKPTCRQMFEADKNNHSTSAGTKRCRTQHD